jgi:hypothetical protein
MFSKKRICNFSDSLKVEFPFIQVGNLNDTTVVKCTVCSSIFSIMSGGRASITDYLQVKKQKNALLAKYLSRCMANRFHKLERSKAAYVRLCMKVRMHIILHSTIIVFL